jgi:VanZ family protein
MNISKSRIIVFRISLASALIAITILATTPLEYPVVSGVNDKLNHIFAFFVLVLLADVSFFKNKLMVRIILPLFGYGIAIEVIQHFLPYRMFSLFDVTANMIGLLLYLICRPTLNYYFSTGSRSKKIIK